MEQAGGWQGRRIGKEITVFKLQVCSIVVVRSRIFSHILLTSHSTTFWLFFVCVGRGGRGDK